MSPIKAIAVQTLAQGGLGNWHEGSREDIDFFQQVPHIIDGRPESQQQWLEWLLPRQDRLRLLVNHDLISRSLDGQDSIDGQVPVYFSMGSR